MLYLGQPKGARSAVGVQVSAFLEATRRPPQSSRAAASAAVCLGALRAPPLPRPRLHGPGPRQADVSQAVVRASAEAFALVLVFRHPSARTSPRHSEASNPAREHSGAIRGIVVQRTSAGRAAPLRTDAAEPDERQSKRRAAAETYGRRTHIHTVQALDVEAHAVVPGPPGPLALFASRAPRSAPALRGVGFERLLFVGGVHAFVWLVFSSARRLPAQLERRHGAGHGLAQPRQSPYQARQARGAGESDLADRNRRRPQPERHDGHQPSQGRRRPKRLVRPGTTGTGTGPRPCELRLLTQQWRLDRGSY
mmetsp:Transcript_15305/g.30869  ORF Transcript_15305/g.30869 Transcript_15305/m.30869 type:complete len:309 (+) Transcript_15305:445-1371(+)